MGTAMTRTATVTCEGCGQTEEMWPMSCYECGSGFDTSSRYAMSAGWHVVQGRPFRKATKIRPAEYFEKDLCAECYRLSQMDVGA